MATMPINNHLLTYRRLQVIGTSVNKLTLKSINLIQSSNNYNIVSSFICWNQNIVHMKSGIPRLRSQKLDLGLGGKKCVLQE